MFLLKIVVLYVFLQLLYDKMPVTNLFYYPLRRLSLPLFLQFITNYSAIDLLF